jgi:hypothetical protein
MDTVTYDGVYLIAPLALILTLLVASIVLVVLLLRCLRAGPGVPTATFDRVRRERDQLANTIHCVQLEIEILRADEERGNLAYFDFAREVEMILKEDKEGGSPC